MGFVKFLGAVGLIIALIIPSISCSVMTPSSPVSTPTTPTTPTLTSTPTIPTWLPAKEQLALNEMRKVTGISSANIPSGYYKSDNYPEGARNIQVDKDTFTMFCSIGPTIPGLADPKDYFPQIGRHTYKYLLMGGPEGTDPNIEQVSEILVMDVINGNLYGNLIFKYIREYHTMILGDDSYRKQ